MSESPKGSVPAPDLSVSQPRLSEKTDEANLLPTLQDQVNSVRRRYRESFVPLGQPAVNGKGSPSTQMTDRYGFFLDVPEDATRQQLRPKTSSSLKSVASLKTLRPQTSLQSFSGQSILNRPSKVTESRSYDKKESKRIKKWASLVDLDDSGKTGAQKIRVLPVPKLIRRTFKGIPERWRCAVWRSLLSDSYVQVYQVDESIRRHYERLCSIPSEHDMQIDMDIPRTISGHVMFQTRYDIGQRTLFRVLHSISLEYPGTGYVQGMASVAATLLSYYPEDVTFAMMCTLWDSRGLKYRYEPGFDVLISAFDRLSHDMESTKVGSYLLSIGIIPASFATRWYLTLFHYSLPFHTQLRVWDILFLLGKDQQRFLDILHATAMALVLGLKQDLFGASFEHCMKRLTSPLAIHNDDALLHRISSLWKNIDQSIALMKK